MKRYEIKFADEAWLAIEAQIRFIAVENHAPENASRWTARLLKAIGNLEQLPKRNSLDEQQTQIHGILIYRLVFERKYILFYAVDDTLRKVNIVSFRHGAQKDDVV